MNLARKLALIFFVFSVLIISTNSTYANDTVEVQVDIMGDTVSIDVPDSLYLGEVARGFKTDELSVRINNTGNTDVLISPQISGSDVLFTDYLFFSNSTTDSTFKNADSFSMTIRKPESMNGIRSATLYLKMDLADYTGTLPSGLNTRRADVTFIATKA